MNSNRETKDEIREGEKKVKVEKSGGLFWSFNLWHMAKRSVQQR